jgi:hypothetical protein
MLPCQYGSAYSKDYVYRFHVVTLSSTLHRPGMQVAYGHAVAFAHDHFPLFMPYRWSLNG